MTVKEVFELRRAGRVEEAYRAILPMYRVHHGKYTTLAMFWCAADMMNLLLSRAVDSTEISIAALKLKNILRSIKIIYTGSPHA